MVGDNLRQSDWWSYSMKRVGLAITGGVALVLGVFSANAAEMPATSLKTEIASSHGIKLPNARTENTAQETMVVAQRQGGRGSGRRGTSRRATNQGGGSRRSSSKRRRNRKIGAGVAIGAAILGAAIIANQPAYADDRRDDRYRDRRYNRRNSCRSLRRRCNRGSDRACYKFDRRC
jgi:hypothetical protein